MQKNNNIIRLNEQQFHRLIAESVNTILQENKFGKVGDWLTVIAMSLPLTFGVIKTKMDEGKYGQDGIQTEMTIKQEIERAKAHVIATKGELPKDEMDKEIAKELQSEYDEAHLGESKLNSMIGRILKEEISKVL